MHPRNLRIEDYTYDLPDARIAQYPLQQRDASKLLIYTNGQIAEDTYSHLADHIPVNTLMVFNQTKVVHARLPFAKPTGGAIEIFCLEPHSSHSDIQTAMLQKGQVWWNCLVGSAKKWKDSITLTLPCPEAGFTLSATMVNKSESYYTIQLDWDNPDMTFAEVLHHAGKVPLPPYLNRLADVKDEERYQTIFAKDEGSVAAPTAGLHFTDAVMNELAAKDVDKAFVTLHVGAGTFKPVKSETMQEHDMHAEWIEVNASTIQQLLQHGDNKIVAVGTTSLRTLESLYWIGCKLFKGMAVDMEGIAINQWDAYEITDPCPKEEALNALLNHMAVNGTNKIVTRTRILIAPGYTFRIIDGLVTNFHQPQSTLLLLVSALIGENWRKVYGYAMAHDFRFLSYGDGSLLWKQK
ncbi:S-adenosylmethionine tRNA ribosyltransferase [Flavipsychrobacter stenotrophus]|uniref:S-adenosylmethionine:tRNA ribosyltransferase-isomerase n=1 Tax=Flavipsychrobacter stenotrophus TaxID=2077091 RepID=A0A2S7SXH1_9BACT|nr:S-adenosylmethionine:tRNA ribosyltransferase-isomerase [Flavipsychrobacter stenotrophus]PQJ11623.1 S-adenosylmethionine tRNA ribosyltransferase [Flavipsychrobacter stenotrophus]